MKILTELPEWQALQAHCHTIQPQHMRQWFAKDPDRSRTFSLYYKLDASQNLGIFFDYSRNRVQKETIELLCQLAQAVALKTKIDNLFTGLAINTTEQRPALHSALRRPQQSSLLVAGKDVIPEIIETRQRMQKLTRAIHTGTMTGITGKRFTHIINIGIGGSYLGPKMCAEALKPYKISDLHLDFISTVDRTGLDEVLHDLDPETALFIVSSKTFSTIETLTNAETIRHWLQSKLGPNALKHHFIAVTCAEQKAIDFGVNPEHILPLWDWVGGRYSVWSAIGLPLMLMIGVDHFDAFLAGGYAIDQHFQTAEFTENIPVLMALLSIWNMNFLHASAQAIIPYAHRLRYLIPYLQQAEMESNGKSISLAGKPINYSTGPIIFGEEGCNGQHAYHQLLLQGQHLVPADFILIGKPGSSNFDQHQNILIASAISQATALMRGKTYEEAYQELIDHHYSEAMATLVAQHRMIPGNRPSNILFLEALNPKTLGALIAIYEHKIFVQGVIWDINSFDQWGVELGKQLLPNILLQLEESEPLGNNDHSTADLIAHFKKIRADYE